MGCGSIDLCSPEGKETVTSTYRADGTVDCGRSVRYTAPFLEGISALAEYGIPVLNPLGLMRESQQNSERTPKHRGDSITVVLFLLAQLHAGVPERLDRFSAVNNIHLHCIPP